jgi:hypothetical protein
VTITPVGVLGSTATFSLTADEPVTYACNLSKNGRAGGWKTCSDTVVYKNLKIGTYVLSVRATDEAGNRSAPIRSDPWVVKKALPVDTTPPAVTVTPVGVPGATATFNLTANETNVTFACQLTVDVTVGPWEACTSPKTYTLLEPASYVFSARGTDKSGNVSLTKTQSWVVEDLPDTTLPVVTITPVGVLGSTATFSLTADEPVTYACNLSKNGRAGGWKTCSDTVVYKNLGLGLYVLSVRATDAAGNRSDPVRSDWWIVKGRFHW